MDIRRIATRALIIGIAVISVGCLVDRAVGLQPPDGNGPSVIFGTEGDDVLRGGRGPDVVFGLGGDDTIWTGKGGPGDEVYGGSGDDRLNNWGSGAAPGLLKGGAGFDRCTGDPHDTFVGCEVVAFK